ncbi:hypothetical protein N7456_006296 [Penicillium angulare]|uniref:Uncharacterized protein n=1 Tax=Penicillium angulare TaxID=116970 RepID=A0A9W9KBJ9_9EURO|nr:hypothetical protein N7456_006296 [Penicillium angulare]
MATLTLKPQRLARIPNQIQFLTTSRSRILHLHRQSHASTRHASSHSKSLPKIADASVWTSMIPRFIRERKSKSKSGEKKSKEWNPATFYIVMFTLIGSQAIRMLTLKNSYATYTRAADAKIELLREVIERVQSGEKVDVERLLGTGDEGKEREWEDVLREIEREDDLWQSKRSKEAKEKEAAEAEAETKMKSTSTHSREAVPVPVAGEESESAKAKSSRKLNFF